MGLGSEGFKVGSWDRRKSKDSNKKSAKSENSGCWMKFKHIRGCMPLRARMDSGSISGYTGEDEHSPSINFTSIAPPVFPIGLSSKNRKITTASSTSDINFTSIALPGVPVGSSSRNRKITTASSTSNITDDLKISSQLLRFSFHELKLVTRNFKPQNLLGEGGFGCVFKGWISEKRKGHAKPGTGLAVAVKTLNHRGLQGHKEWLAEVNYLGALLHPNLVKLIGYCIEGDQRLLVYEFMARGSLENHLFRRSLPLSWAIRLKIVLGAARGLAFLHDEAKRPVIFRDFKSSNILLDAEYNAKLSDFGLAKDGPEGDRTHVSTRVMGTYGYAAPEYIMTGHLTSKSDVYSFGVVLLELLTGRKSMDKTRPHGQHNLVEWARPQMANRGMFYQLIDPKLEGHYSIKGAQKAVQLAASCLSRDPKARPRMSDVVQVLKPLLNLQDMACSSSSFQTMEGSGSNHGGRCSQKTQYGSSSRGGTPTRSAPTDMQASPSRHSHLLRSPKPTVGLQASPSHHNHPLHSPKPNAGPQASPSCHNHPLHSPRYNVGPQASPSRHSHRLQSPKPYGGQH